MHIAILHNGRHQPAHCIPALRNELKIHQRAIPRYHKELLGPAGLRPDSLPGGYLLHRGPAQHPVAGVRESGPGGAGAERCQGSGGE